MLKVDNLIYIYIILEVDNLFNVNLNRVNKRTTTYFLICSNIPQDHMILDPILPS